MKVMSLLLKVLSVLLLIVSLSCGTTGGSALPQASLPPAENCDSGGGCITVTNADSNGVVTVTGSAGAVTSAAVVQLSVDSVTTSRIIELLDSLIPSSYAQATTCTSTFSRCSADSSADECYVIANDDGSFFAQIQASIGEQVSVTYLDSSNSCRVSEAYQEIIDGDFINLGVDAVAITTDRGGTAFILGESGDPDIKIIEVVTIPSGSGETASISNAVDASILGDPLSISSLPNSSDRLLLLTNEVAVLADIDETSTTLNTIGSYAVESGNYSPSLAAVQKGFSYPENISTDEDFTCVSSTLDGVTLDRVFFANSASFIADNNTMPISVLNDTVSDPTGGYYATELQYDYDSFATDLSEATLTAVDQIFVSESGASAYFIGKFMLSTGETRFYFIEIPLDDELVCSGMEINVVNFSDLKFIALPSDMESAGSMFQFGEWRVLSSVYDIVLIPDVEAEKIFIVNLTLGTASENVAFSDYSDRFSGLSVVFPRNLPTGYPLYFYGMGNSSFLVEFQLTDAGMQISEIESTHIVGLSPIAMEPYNPVEWGSITSLADLLDIASSMTNDSKLLVLDEGLADDGTSQLRILDVSDL